MFHLTPIACSLREKGMGFKSIELSLCTIANYGLVTHCYWDIDIDLTPIHTST